MRRPTLSFSGSGGGRGKKANQNGCWPSTPPLSGEAAVRCGPVWGSFYDSDAMLANGNSHEKLI